jgi:hypothetical protein
MSSGSFVGARRAQRTSQAASLDDDLDVLDIETLDSPTSASPSMKSNDKLSNLLEDSVELDVNRIRHDYQSTSGRNSGRRRTAADMDSTSPGKRSPGVTFISPPSSPTTFDIFGGDSSQRDPSPRLGRRATRSEIKTSESKSPAVDSRNIPQKPPLDFGSTAPSTIEEGVVAFDDSAFDLPSPTKAGRRRSSAASNGRAGAATDTLKPRSDAVYSADPFDKDEISIENLRRAFDSCPKNSDGTISIA